MKVILNKCFGGFGVSREGYKLYCEKIGKTAYFYKPDYNNHIYVKETKQDIKGLSFYCLTKDYGYSVADKGY